jgi:RsiW-degrading membrane proteinase PrsW (M82 family)
VMNHMMEKYTALWSGADNPLHSTLFWLTGIGLNEEFAKMLVLLAVLYPRRGFTEVWQGLTGAAAVALGFAAVENIIYLERFGTGTLLIRSLLTVPAHAGFTLPLGLCLALSKQAGSTWGKYRWLLTGLLISMGLHGGYDLWLAQHATWLNRMAYVQVLLMSLGAVWLIRMASKLPPSAALSPAPGPTQGASGGLA